MVQIESGRNNTKKVRRQDENSSALQVLKFEQNQVESVDTLWLPFKSFLEFQVEDQIQEKNIEVEEQPIEESMIGSSMLLKYSGYKSQNQIQIYENQESFPKVPPIQEEKKFLKFNNQCQIDKMSIQEVNQSFKMQKKESQNQQLRKVNLNQYTKSIFKEKNQDQKNVKQRGRIEIISNNQSIDAPLSVNNYIQMKVYEGSNYKQKDKKQRKTINIQKLNQNQAQKLYKKMTKEQKEKEERKREEENQMEIEEVQCIMSKQTRELNLNEDLFRKKMRVTTY